VKLLSGLELAAKLKARQSARAKALLVKGIAPRLVIIQVKDDPAINTYVRLKQGYGAEIGVAVDIHFIPQTEAPTLIKQLNEDPTVHGIIVQLPLSDTGQTDEIVDLVAPAKDVDGLGSDAKFEPATPMAIMWLLEEHGIALKAKRILVIGRGKLVGRPLLETLNKLSFNPGVADENTSDLAEQVQAADVIITATGQPGLITSRMIKPGAVIVDAGVASEAGKTVGDLAEEVYQRQDISVTPPKGGVGPLTVCALFENVLAAASKAPPGSQPSKT